MGWQGQLDRVLPVAQDEPALIMLECHRLSVENEKEQPQWHARLDGKV